VENNLILKTPKNIEAEAMCLGAMLIDKNAIFKIQQKLNVDDFYLDKHQVVCQAIYDLSYANKEVNLSSITWYIRDNGLLEKIGGVEFLNSILETCPTSANVDHYIETVLEKSKRRKLIDTARKTIGQSMDESSELNDVFEGTEKDIFNIANRSVGTNFEQAKPILAKTVEKMFIRSGSGRHITGLSTGYAKLDEKLDGLFDGQLVIIAARPGMGKSGIMMNIAENIVEKEKTGVAIFSIEMPKDLLMIRMISKMIRINNNRIRKGDLSKEEWDMILTISDRINTMPLFIDDTSNITIFDIKSKLMALQAKHKIGIVMIDYLQMMKHPEYKDNRQQQVSEISRGLKAMAKQMNICIVALAQLNRKSEGRTDKVPQLSDLRESGSIEADADVVILLHREEYYDKEETKEDKKGKADIIIAKNRNGPVDEFEVGFRAEFTEFYDIDYIHGPVPRDYHEKSEEKDQ